MTNFLLSSDAMVTALNAISELSRLRILVLLKEGDLSVSDLTMILGQSQPRVSRHLKLLQDAHLISRSQEGAWAYFHIEDSQPTRKILDCILSCLGSQDHWFQSDRRRLEEVRRKRQLEAKSYFSSHAAEWDSLRLLYVDEGRIHHMILQMIGKHPIEALLDIGTGTASMLKLLAPLVRSALGIDNNHDMLNIARANLENFGLTHMRVRYGDATALPIDGENFDFVIIHQVLHFLSDPQLALAEAARVLRSKGRLLVVDLGAHNHQFLRDTHAHLRFGFSDEMMRYWFQKLALNLHLSNQVEPQGEEKKLTIKLWLASKN